MKCSVSLFAVALIFLCACSKKEQTIVPSPQEKLDLLTTISNSWELYMYNISTDKGKFYFTGSDIDEHSLRSLTFNKNGTYTCSNALWWGSYLFLNDSTQIVLTPDVSSLIPCLLNLDFVSIPLMQFSSPWVQVNPERAGASDYEKFIAFQGLKFLSDKGQDISRFNTIKIEFRYYPK